MKRAKKPLEVTAGNRTFKLPFVQLDPFAFSSSQREELLALMPRRGDPQTFLDRVEKAATGYRSASAARMYLGKPTPAALRKRLGSVQAQAFSLQALLASLDDVFEYHDLARAVSLAEPLPEGVDAYDVIERLKSDLGLVSTGVGRLLSADLQAVRAQLPADRSQLRAEDLTAYMLESFLAPLETKRGRPPKEHEVQFIREIAQAYRMCFEREPRISRSGIFHRLVCRIFEDVLQTCESADVYRLISRALGR